MSNEPSPARALSDRAIAMLTPGKAFAFAADAHAYSDVVLVALAWPERSCVLSIDSSEYTLDGALTIANMLGFPPAPPLAAIDRARKAKQ